MKVVKLALLGTAALAAVSVSARADNLSDLKAQIEALNGRIAVLEATPSVPAGFMSVSMSKGKIAVPGGVSKDFDHEGTIISVLPTADAPEAAGTVVAWTGYVKAAFVYKTNQYAAPLPPDTFDLAAKAGLRVVGKTETAVGEVGVNIGLQASVGTNINKAGVFNGFSAFNVNYGINGGNAGIYTDGARGWWKLTPNVTLIGGVAGTLGGNGKGFDGGFTGLFAGDANGGFGAPDRDPVQMQLAYADGPIGFAVAVEDGSNWNVAGNVGFAAEASYSGDMFSAEVSAGYQPADGAGSLSNWTVNGGIGAKFDMFSASIAAGVGHEGGLAVGWGAAPPAVQGTPQAGSDYSKVSGLIKANLGDTARIELGASNKWSGGSSNFAAGAGVYYSPVDQLTLGLEGAYNQNGKGPSQTTFDLVTVFTF